MKTKLSFLLISILILSILFTSCGNINTTAKITESQNPSGMLSEFTFHSTMDELLFDIKNPYDNNKDKTLQQKDTEFYQKIKDNGKVYYADVKIEEYTITDILVGGSSLKYSLYPTKSFNGDYSEDLVYAYDDSILFVVEYKRDFQTIINGYTGGTATPVILDNGSAYIDDTDTIIFEYDGIVCKLTLPGNYTGSLDWHDIIDVKYIELSK